MKDKHSWNIKLMFSLQTHNLLQHLLKETRNTARVTIITKMLKRNIIFNYLLV